MQMLQFNQDPFYKETNDMFSLFYAILFLKKIMNNNKEKKQMFRI